ncbi:hypothetical protein DM01DRAFT_21211 [Hesseltinella vesiculosa]|uniref:Uncharacterized protein n=1 Tax=Hesseltinella vesiculosa TaxID=101127 RepID=A0A1X2GPA7_9FUNG|nr:hypothetical protein DM01DRAFT_21211 [Hesseltinella vesiculosa]
MMAKYGSDVRVIASPRLQIQRAFGSVTIQHEALSNTLKVALAYILKSRGDGVSHEKLAQHLNIQPKSASPLTKKLQDLGLITRERGDQNLLACFHNSYSPIEDMKGEAIDHKSSAGHPSKQVNNRISTTPQPISMAPAAAAKTPCVILIQPMHEDAPPRHRYSHSPSPPMPILQFDTPNPTQSSSSITSPATSPSLLFDDPLNAMSNDFQHAHNGAQKQPMSPVPSVFSADGLDEGK